VAVTAPSNVSARNKSHLRASPQRWEIITYFKISQSKPLRARSASDNAATRFRASSPAAHAASMQDQLSWAQAACARAFRPLITLALSLGLKHSQLEDLLRDLLVTEAKALWQSQGMVKPNISQMAVTTGLNRKEVAARVRSPADTLPATDASSAAKVFTRWLQLVHKDESLRRLPIAAGAQRPSFEEVAWEASRGDVHHRAVLDELVRLGMCEKTENEVVLTKDAFVPSTDLQTRLSFLGDNLRDHASAAVANVLGGGPPFLDRVVFADGLTLVDCEAVHSLARQRWAGLHQDLVDTLTNAVEAAGGQGTHRIRVGIYLYHESQKPEGTPAA
jgi:hypothetical protein